MRRTQQLFYRSSSTTPLHIACESGVDSTILEQLLTHGGNELMDAKDRTGRRALHVAALHGHVHALDCLLARGADGNLKTLLGETPLHLATANGA